MKIPRNLSGRDLVKVLAKVGYRVTRQSGSHIRLTTMENGEHHITIPDHRQVKAGTMAGILASVADHFGTTREELASRLFE